MATLGMIIWIIGAIISVIGGIWFLVVAFRQSFWWALGSFFIAIVALVFLIMHWGDAKKPFFVWLIGVVIMILVAILIPGAIPIT